jgi:NAD(P)-dependent dehydrogenase (short-subunit alcohol dehydrogenase family)
MNEVVVVIGAGSIGQAIARRVSAGKQVVLADLNRENADAAAEVMRNAGFDVHTATVDVSSRESVHALVQVATTLGDVTGVCESRWVGPSGAVARVVSSVPLVTRQASGRVRAFAMNRPSVHGDAGLAPAVGLIRSLSAFGA